MKNNYILLAILGLFMWSCDETADPEVFTGESFVAFTTTDESITEAAGLISLPIEISNGATVDTDVTLTATGTAIAGEDYSFPNGMSVTIPAGEYFVDFPVQIIDDNEFGEAVTLVLEITGNSAGATIGLAETSSFLKTVTINNDDCNDMLTGAYDSSSLLGRGDGAGGTNDDPLLGPIPYAVDVTLEGCSGSEVVYTISDITGGLYVLGYGAADNPATIIHNLDTNAVTVDTPNSQDVVYGGDEFSGSGEFNPATGQFVLAWSNGYGDQGISTFTPQ